MFTNNIQYCVLSVCMKRKLYGKRYLWKTLLYNQLYLKMSTTHELTQLLFLAQKAKIYATFLWSSSHNIIKYVNHWWLPFLLHGVIVVLHVDVL